MQWYRHRITFCVRNLLDCEGYRQVFNFDNLCVRTNSIQTPMSSLLQATSAMNRNGLRNNEHQGLIRPPMLLPHSSMQAFDANFHPWAGGQLCVLKIKSKSNKQSYFKLYSRHYTKACDE